MAVPGEDADPGERADPAELRPASATPPALSHDEIVRLEEELRPLVEPPHVRPEVHAANTAIGVADELGRLILSFVIVTVVLTALAVGITPWFWVAVAGWLGLAVATILGLRARRRRRAAPVLPRIEPKR